MNGQMKPHIVPIGERSPCKFSHGLTVFIFVFVFVFLFLHDRAAAVLPLGLLIKHFALTT